MRVRELEVRYRTGLPVPSKRFSNSREIWQAFKDDLMSFPVEVFRVIFLDCKNRMMCFEDISRGSLSSSLVHPREVFWSAVHLRASSIVCCHNHPSGDPAPSREDRECTNRLMQAGRILGIRVLDHIVFGQEDYFSFADTGLLQEGL